MKNNKAFTLVELVVTITILAILGTIAFMSLQGYSAQSRDSVRITDISSIKTSLELFKLESGNYPIPSNGVNVLYSGSTVWTQGTFGESVFKNVTKLDKIPLDPVTEKEYTYTVTSNRYEFQLGGIVEGDELVMNNYSVLQTNAGETTAYAYTTGNYNGQMTKTNTGTTCTILAVPNIMTNDDTVLDLQTIVNNNSFVYRGYKNLPSTFKSSKYKYNGGFAFTPNNLVAYTDTGSCAKLVDKNDNSARVTLINGLKTAYSGTIIKEVGEIKKILDLDINVNNPNAEVLNFAGYFVNNNLGGNVSVENKNFSCPAQPSYTHATFVEGQATELNHLWQNTNASLPCYYSCNSGYSGTDCNTQLTCASQPAYSHATFTVGTPTQSNQAWQNSNSGSPCYYSCTAGYSGVDCNTLVGVTVNTSGGDTGFWWNYLGNGCTNDPYSGAPIVNQVKKFCKERGYQYDYVYGSQTCVVRWGSGFTSYYYSDTGNNTNYSKYVSSYAGGANYHFFDSIRCIP